MHNWIKMSVPAAILAALMGFAGSPQAMAAQECGRASWYAMNSRTASGERMNPAAMTAAHRRYPFGTKLKVTNQHNGKSVIIRINDRGPFVRGRILDVSKAAAKQLGFIRAGHAKICVTRVS